MVGGKSLRIGWSQEGLPNNICGSPNFDHLCMQRGEPPFVWISRNDDAGNVFACLDVHETEVVLRGQIVRQLTNGYQPECCSQLGRGDFPRNEHEEILRQQFVERSKLQSRRGARMLCSLALRVAEAKVLEERVAAAGEVAKGVVAVVAAIAGAPEVQVTGQGGSCAPICIQVCRGRNM